MDMRRVSLAVLADACAETARVAARETANRAAAQQLAEAATRRRSAQTRRNNAQQLRRQRYRSVAVSSLGLLAASVPVWALIPIIGSFVSIASNNFTKIIFLRSSETGATTGGGPETLYLLLFWLIPGTILSLAVCGILFPYPSGSAVVSPATAWGFALGFVITMYQGFAGSGSAASWWWPAVLAVGAHLTYGLVLQSRTARDE